MQAEAPRTLEITIHRTLGFGYPYPIYCLKHERAWRFLFVVRLAVGTVLSSVPSFLHDDRGGLATRLSRGELFAP